MIRNGIFYEHLFLFLFTSGGGNFESQVNSMFYKENNKKKTKYDFYFFHMYICQDSDFIMFRLR